MKWIAVDGEMDFLKAPDLFLAKVVMEHLGLIETPVFDTLARLDDASRAGWTGKMLDIDEVTPWDVLYREVVLHHAIRWQ